MKRGDPRLLGTLAYATPVASTLLLLAAGEGAFTWRVAAALALVAGGGWLAARAGRTEARAATPWRTSLQECKNIGRRPRHSPLNSLACRSKLKRTSNG